MIPSLEAEKGFDKIQRPFMIKVLNKLKTEGNFPKMMMKGIYEKPTVNGKRMKSFSVRSGIRQGHPLSPLLFNIVLEVLGRAIRQEKETQIRKEKVKLSLFAGDIILCIENSIES